MSGDSGNIIEYRHLSRKIGVVGEASKRRLERNAKDADALASLGYNVERNLHRNGAFFAVIGNHPDHEVEVGRIFAENGFAFTLDKEGNAHVKIKGRTYTLPSSDGHVEGFTHEIYALKGKPSATTVANAISHSYKTFKPDTSKSIQADIAITITPKGSQYRKNHIKEGVDEYKRRLAQGETKARPLLYLHVNESTRAIYQWRIK